MPAASVPAICTAIGATSPSWFARRAVFSDIRVREAIAALFDFEWINHNLFFDQPIGLLGERVGARR